MKSTLKSSIVALVAVAVSAAFVSAQETEPKVPNIAIQKVDFKTIAMPNADPSYPKWAQTVIDFKVNPSKDYQPQAFLNNVKMTLTLLYDKTAAAGEGVSKARGAKGKEIVEKEAKEAGGTGAAKHTTYRASVTFASLKIGDGKKQYAFYIPGEIVDRDKEKMSGSAKPKYYYIEFEYDGMVIGAYSAKGERRPNYMDCPTATGNDIVKKPEDFDQVCEWADAGAFETRGLLIPLHWAPGFGQLKIGSVPSIVRPEVQQ